LQDAAAGLGLLANAAIADLLDGAEKGKIFLKRAF
jgi:hypothetical protein